MVITTYLIYLTVSIVIAVWVGQSLHQNGRLFLIQSFEGNTSLADSVNHLLLVGFYLINIGFITLALKYGDKPVSIEEMIESLSTKIGLVIIILGVMHFFNMRALVQYRRFHVMQPVAKPVKEATHAGA